MRQCQRAWTMLVVCSGLLGGCVYPVTSGQVASAQQGLAQYNIVLGSAELGAYGKPSSFPAAAPLYAQSIRSFDASKPKSKRFDTPSLKDEKEQLRGNIENCIGNLKEVAGLHRDTGLPSNPDVLSLYRETCASTARILRNSR